MAPEWKQYIQGLKVKEYVRVGFSLTKTREDEERYSAGDRTSDNMLLSCVLDEQNPKIICLRMNSTLLTGIGLRALISYPLPSVKTLVQLLQENNSRLLVTSLYGHPRHCLKQFLRI